MYIFVNNMFIQIYIHMPYAKYTLAPFTVTVNFYLFILETSYCNNWCYATKNKPNFEPISLKVMLHSSCVIPAISSHRNYLQLHPTLPQPLPPAEPPLFLLQPYFCFLLLCAYWTWVCVSSKHLGVICTYVSFRPACAPVTNALPFAVFSLIYVCRVT